MKILVVTHDANFSGGANRSLFTNIQVLKDKYNIEFLVLLPSANGALNKKLDEINIPWLSTKYFGVVSGLRHDGKDVLRHCKVILGYYIEKVKSKTILTKLRNANIDLVYTNTRLPMIGANIAKDLDVPHVVHVREFGTVEPLWGKWDFKTMYSMSDKIILISKALKEQFLEHVPDDKLLVSHNGIQYNSVVFSENNLESDSIHLILAGRLVPDKGHKDAILAINKIVKNKLLTPNIVLHIVGSSPRRTHIEWYERELREMVEGLGLGSNIIFEGEISDMPAIRKKMDIELVCSICETFGRVTVEAMRSNLFVIGSNTGGTPEIIDNGFNGLLYEQGNSDDLADQILYAVENVSRFNEIRKNALQFSKTNFTVEKNCEEIYSVLSSCLEDKQTK